MKEALKLALEALEDHGHAWPQIHHESQYAQTMIAVRETLAQQSNEQVEPVAKVDSRFDSQVIWYLDQLPKDGTKLYTHPPVPTAQPKPLTDEKISLIAHNTDTCDWNDLNFKECWHEGFKAGFREAEIEHNIKG